MDLTEAEIQVLASIAKLSADGMPVNDGTIADRGESYWIFKEDWDGVCDSLIKKNLIVSEPDGYRMTSSGIPLGDHYRGERVDLYWYYYQKFYPCARASKAHSELCERVFGKDLCQEGQTDMDSLEYLIGALDLTEGGRVLDLGCGAGVISEYISDQTGAHVEGLDYADTAIAEALNRTAKKRLKLNFLQANFNQLDLVDNSFDAIVSIDTLYWASELGKTLAQLKQALKPGGMMAIFFNHHIDDGDSPEKLAASGSELYKALESGGFEFETIDFTNAVKHFWRRTYAVATELRAQFEDEGNGFIPASLIRESEQDYLPDVEANRISRYLYLVSC